MQTQILKQLIYSHKIKREELFPKEHTMNPAPRVGTGHYPFHLVYAILCLGVALQSMQSDPG